MSFIGKNQCFTYYYYDGGYFLTTWSFFIFICSIVVGRKGEYYQLLYDLLGKGFNTVKVDGEVKKLREQIILANTKSMTLMFW
jgi:excinuclease UvrABC ATPase subunit